MYDKPLFLKLNNYGYSEENIEEVKEYLINLQLPQKIDTKVKARSYDEKQGQFDVRNNNSFYKKLESEEVP